MKGFLFDQLKLLKRLEKNGREFWNVNRETAFLIYFFTRISKAKKVLEIGTSNGYSGIWIAAALSGKPGGVLYTIESNEKRFEMAQKNFGKTGFNCVIVQIKGHAPEVLSELSEQKFDLIFLDATKEEYLSYFNFAENNLRKGGILLADNVISHRNKLKNFLEAVENNDSFSSEVIDTGGGLLVAFKES